MQSVHRGSTSSHLVCLAFLACCIVGLIWRKQGRKWLKRLIRYFDISWSDDDPSALASLLADSDNQLSQIAVLLDDGTLAHVRRH